MTLVRDPQGRLLSTPRSDKPVVTKCLSLGASLLHRLDKIVVARGTSRSVEAVRYATRALNAPEPPGLDPRPRPCCPAGGRVVNDGARQADKQTPIRATPEFWERIRTWADKYGSNYSEAMRVLVRNGMVISRPSDRPLRKIDPLKRAARLLDGMEKIDLKTLTELMWPDRGLAWPAQVRPQGGDNYSAARTLTRFLEDRQIVVPLEKGTWSVNKTP